jgi:Helix-turn-helix
LVSRQFPDNSIFGELGPEELSSGGAKTTGTEIRPARVAEGIPGSLVSQRAGISRSRLSDIERGYVQPSDKELTKIETALHELIEAKRRVSEVASECGWPLSAV